MRRMDEVRVSDLMTCEVEAASPDTTITAFCRLAAAGGFTSAPVLDGDGHLVGIVSRTDVVRAMIQGGADDSSPDYEDIVDLLSSRFVEFDERKHPRRFTYVEEIMATKVVTIAPEASALDAARLMSGNRIHRLPVLRDGRLVGIISSFDLMRYFTGEQPAK